MRDNYQQMEMVAPDVADGAYLEGQRSLFSVVVPEATENLIANPSPVLNTTGYSAMAGAIASSTTRQRRGPNSIRVAPTGATTDGAYYGTVTTVTGWNTFSLDFWGYPGVPYKIYFATTGAALLGTAVEFVGEGLWRRPEVKLYEAAGTTRRVYFTKNGSADTNYFYVDGLQVEAKDHSTTFCMGDMAGFLPNQKAYYWTGAQYGSTSIRIADTGSGGRVVPLSEYGFRLMAHTGLGMAPAANIAFPYARVDGENYQTTRLEGRDFSLVGTISGATYFDLMDKKALLTNSLHPNRTHTRQPLLLLYQYANEYGQSISENIYQLKCSYIDGLRGNVTNKNQERVGLNFRKASPEIITDGVTGATLSYTRTVTNTAYVAAKINDEWQALGTGFNGTVACVRVDKVHGRVWFCGGFTTANGVTVNGFCYWDTVLKNFVAVGGATKGVAGGTGPHSMIVLPDGDVWVLGGHTSAGGSACDGLARWNNATDTFTCFDLSAGANFWSGAVDSKGKIYFVGDVTNWNGDAAQDYVTSYSMAGAWAAVGTPPYSANELPFASNCAIVDKNDHLIVGSVAAGGGVAGHLRMWDESTWTDLGATASALSERINVVFQASDGRIYIGGSFSSLGGITFANICSYNYSTFSPVGPGLSGSPVASYGIMDIDEESSGAILVNGNIIPLHPFTSTTLVRWNGSTWTVLDIISPEQWGSGSVKVFNDDIYVAWAAEAVTSSEASYVTSVTNNGSEDAYPTISMYSNGALVWICNETTGDVLNFDIGIFYQELVVLNLSPNKTSFISNFRGDVRWGILGGSNFPGFKLAPGVNKISVLVANIYGFTPGVDTYVKMIWNNTYAGLEN